MYYQIYMLLFFLATTYAIWPYCIYIIIILLYYYYYYEEEEQLIIKQKKKKNNQISTVGETPSTNLQNITYISMYSFFITLLTWGIIKAINTIHESAN